MAGESRKLAVWSPTPTPVAYTGARIAYAPYAPGTSCTAGGRALAAAAAAAALLTLALRE